MMDQSTYSLAKQKDEQESKTFWSADKHAQSENATAIGLLILDLGPFDLPLSKFDAMFRLYLKFHHPNPGDLKVFRDTPARIYYLPSDVMEYLPCQSIGVSNEMGVEKVTNNFYGEENTFLVFHKKGEPKNTLNAELMMKGSFKHIFNLASFPADTQVMKIKMLLYKCNDADHHRVWLNISDVPPHDVQGLSLPDYEVEEIDQTNLVIEKIGDTYQVHFNLFCFRKHGFHTLAATVPMTMVVILTPASYSIDVDEVADRLSMGFTLLLSAVAVNFVVAPDMPKVSYPTALDIDTLVLYTYLLLVIIGQCYLKAHDELAQHLAFMALPVILLFLWRSAFISMVRWFRRVCLGRKHAVKPT